MSSTGAEGAAREGLNQRQIVGIDHPGTPAGDQKAGTRPAPNTSGSHVPDDTRRRRPGPGLTVRDSAAGSRRLPFLTSARRSGGGGGSFWLDSGVLQGCCWLVDLAEPEGVGLQVRGGGDPVTLATWLDEGAETRGKLRAVPVAPAETSGHCETDDPAELTSRAWSRARSRRNLEPRRRPGAGGGRAHLRGLRAGAPAYLPLPRSATPRPARSTRESSKDPASNRAVNATRRQKTAPDKGGILGLSRSSCCRTAAGCRRRRCRTWWPSCTWIYGMVGQPSPHLVDEGHRHAERERRPLGLGNLRRIVVVRRDGNGEWTGRGGSSMRWVGQ